MKKTLIVLLFSLALGGCLFPKLPVVPHQHVVPDGVGGYRVYEIR